MITHHRTSNYVDRCRTPAVVSSNTLYTHLSFAKARRNSRVANIRAHLHLTGRVQGVYFRDFTRREALRLGLKGWVRNLPDGRVEAVAEGEEEKIEELIRICHRGPPLAIVKDVRIQREPPTCGFETFTIRY